jgi:hypothetical protein
MKPPVDIEKLMAMWSEDAPIDETEPSKELARIPQLHAKYLSIMTHHSLIVKKLSAQYNQHKRIKWEYYSGDLNNPLDLHTYGLEPNMKKILRTDIPMYLDSDAELNSILLKKVMNEEIVDFCKAVIKELQNRTWQIKEYIGWEKFTHGG